MKTGVLRYYKYHGQERQVNDSITSEFDIVLTTYGTVTADYVRQRNTLTQIQWYRVILDEG
jgi:SWI/SNF-related matrix-associated actin-dependent regulator of chromatin subfamily A3